MVLFSNLNTTILHIAPDKQTRTNVAILSVRASRDMKSIAVGPLSACTSLAFLVRGYAIQSFHLILLVWIAPEMVELRSEDLSIGENEDRAFETRNPIVRIGGGTVGMVSWQHTKQDLWNLLMNKLGDPSRVRFRIRCTVMLAGERIVIEIIQFHLYRFREGVGRKELRLCVPVCYSQCIGIL